MARLLLILPLLLCLTVRADEAPLPLDAKQLRVELEAVRTKHDLPAMGVVIVRSSGAALIEVVGVRKRGSDVKATREDCFHLGSDTKPLTALLVAALVAEKKLAYDSKLETLLPDLAKKMHKDYRAVTLEQVMTHRAGLPKDHSGGWWKLPRNIPPHSARTTVAKVALEAEPTVAPGTKFEYSNVGYVIAGAICERAGKANWEELIKTHVFTPLGMKSAGFGAMGTRGKLDQPLQHSEEGKSLEAGAESDNPPVLGPAGRVHCSLSDWAKFAADHLKGAQGKPGLLPVEAYRKLHVPAAKGQEYTPGGFLYLPGRAGAFLVHDGSNTMNFASALLNPSKDIGFLIVTNQGGKKARDACHQLRDVLVKKLAP